LKLEKGMLRMKYHISFFFFFFFFFFIPVAPSGA
jgi:hypothetical protein